jgi:shikimate kinase
MKLFLIGMPGSGKSTVGKQLAEALKLPFVDLDDELITKEKQSIAIVFTEKGEEYFRQSESEVLQEWAKSDRDFVMATGGGAPCFHKGIEIINRYGISVFIDTPIDVILKRLEKEDHRPLLQSDKRKRLEELRDVRINVYQEAQIIIENSDRPAEEIMQKLSARK